MKHKFTYILSIIALLFLFVFCKETLVSDNENLKDLTLAVQVVYSEDCNPSVFLPAEGADVKIYLPEDTISDQLDINGFYSTGEIADSKFGFSNTEIQVFYEGFFLSKTYDMLCCSDTLFDTLFSVSCEPPVIIDCSAINRTENITIHSVLKDCIPVNATNLVNNAFRLECQSPMRFSWDAAIFDSEDKNIWIEKAGTVGIDENFVELDEQDLFVLYFDVNNSEYSTDTPFSETFTIQVTCLNPDGSEGESGEIVLNVDADLCDPTVCDCPVSDNFSFEVDIRDTPVMLGESKENIPIALDDILNNLGENCVYTITDISVAEGETNNAWVVDDASLPIELTQDSYNQFLYATFTPTHAIEYVERFIVTGSIESSLGDGESTECSFSLELAGAGCSTVCPDLVIYNVKKGYLLDNDGTNLGDLRFNDRIQMGNSTTIVQSFDVAIASKCEYDSFLDNPILVYHVEMPDTVDLCSDYSVTDVSLESGDVNNFVAFATGNIITASFYRNLITGDDKDNYSVVVSVTAEDDHNNSCKQEIRLDVTVNDVPDFNNNVFPMFAFSQSYEGYFPAAYSVFKIDKFNEVEQNFGSIVNLDNQNYGLVNGEYNAPRTSHSLYFDIDEPDVYKAQIPKLYLIQSTENVFTHVAELAGISYASSENFNQAYEESDLIDQIFSRVITRNGGSFWPGYQTSSSLDFPNGLEIEEGHVYVIWNPYSPIDDTNNLFCDMALLYIEHINPGGQNGNNDRALVNIYVQYPVSAPSN